MEDLKRGMADRLVTDATIRAMVDAIVAEAEPEQVILFGSRGRGDHRTGSDVDLIVVEGEGFGPGRSRLREMTRLNAAVRDFGVTTDILVYSRAEVGYWRDSLNHVVARALREGKVVYGSGEGAVVPAAGCDHKAAREMLEAAHADLIMLEEATPRIRDETFGLHAQHATEKALKAWLALLGRKYPLVHDPGVFFQRIAAAGASTGFFRPLAHFTPFAAESATTGFPRTTVPWTAPRRSPWSAR